MLTIYSDWLPKVELSSRLQSLFDSRSITIVNFSKRSGISRNYLYLLLDKRANPTVGIISKIARAFDITVVELLQNVDLTEYE